MKNLIVFITLVLFYLTSTQLLSQSVFTGANSTDWADPGNWTLAVPLPNSNPIIPANKIAWNNGYIQVANMQINGTLINTGVLENNNLLWIDFTGTIINKDNGLIINNSESLEPPTELPAQIWNYGNFSNGSNGTFINNGDFVNYCAGVIDNDIYGTINNFGTIEQNGAMFNSGDLVNDGIFYQDDLGCGDINGIFYNDGTIINSLNGYFSMGESNILNTNFNLGQFYNCLGTYEGESLVPNAIEEVLCAEIEICDGMDNDLDGEIDEGCGCTNILACNYDYGAIANDGSCILPDGCSNSLACNYDPTAICDDGSCEYVSCLGCTYPEAVEYDPLATIDDGSCSMTASSCPGDLNNDTLIDTADLLNFLSLFGGTCP